VACSISEAVLVLIGENQRRTGQLEPSAWSHFLLIAGFVAVVAAAVIIALFVKRRSLERRIYWAGWIIGILCMSLAFLPRGWRSVIAVALLCAFAAVVYAYFQTPYLKLGNRIYALTIPDSQPDEPEDGGDIAQPPRLPHDSYDFMGGITAGNVWWVVVGVTCIAAANAILFGWVLSTILLAAFMVAVAAMLGVDDATRKLPIARDQKVQAYFATVASIPLWLLPTIAYLVGYQIGKRRPMGKGKHAAPPHGT
jgi:Ca2+/Na+ antiporter